MQHTYLYMSAVVLHDYNVKLLVTRFMEEMSVFVFIDFSVVPASQDAGGYAISSQNNLELHLSCHTCSLSYFTLVYLWCGRTDGLTVT